jgi:DNA-binding response OmpR family regulator/S1-C subfamily serine protease
MNGHNFSGAFASMTSALERVVIVESDPAARAGLVDAMQAAGHDVAAFATFPEALDELHRACADVLLLDAAGRDAIESVAALRASATTASTRVILSVSGGPQERAVALDSGADDAVPRPFEPAELLARVRAQLRGRRTEAQMRHQMRVAQEGQEIAHTAFEALAVTEKMASDATSLDRRLKIGVASAFGVLILMAGLYFLFARSAQKETQRVNITLSRLEGSLLRQQDLAAQARKLRETQAAAGGDDAIALQKRAADLKAKMSGASADQLDDLKKQLDDTNARVKRVESDGTPEAIIRDDVQSVCLLHVTVAFRSQHSGQRLRYAGTNSQGEPLQDSEGNPVLTTDGTGPEVALDIFGTGFLVGSSGRLLTNRHVAQPWWKNQELSQITDQGFRPEISAIRAYFPGDARAFHVEIQQISDSADLASMQADLQGLKRPALPIDTGNTAAVRGGSMVVMGYATGLAAILARTDEDTAQQIVKNSSGDVSQILDELARRGLIRPVITQGHIGDILPDKIVFDAQTTSGGSGGPLFNDQGKVIGVTYAILEGFGGSNFGIPIRFSSSVLVPAAPHGN